MELLVVIAILALLMALLVPAVQTARESARRTQCVNNLKQIALAVHSHAFALRAYPGGGYPGTVSVRVMNGTSPALFDTQNWGWPFQILPYIEQRTIWENPDDNVAVAVTPGHHFCPTRRPPTAIKGGYWAATNTFRGMIDYAGNAGTSSTGGNGAGVYGNGNDGVFCALGTGRRTSDQITDGLSQTLLAGEKLMNVSYCTTDQQPDDNVGYVGGFQDDIVRWGAAGTSWGNFTPGPDKSGPPYTWATLPPSIWRFGSSHSGQAMFVFCDGATRAIGFDVAPLTFQQLCTIRGGEAIDQSAY